MSEIQEYTLRIRRYNPESGEAAYYDEFTVELEPHASVLEAILQAKAKEDGSIGIRCSCRAAICGSCGVRINGKPGLACHTHIGDAALRRADGVIEVEPLGNMPVIKDLIVDMDAVHWKKQKRVIPWLQPKLPLPEREHIVAKEAMVDVTQSMACIQCGACVSECQTMEIDPDFVGPAALAKAYRFVGDPRDDQHKERLDDLANDPHGIYACTHCFQCVEACPKGVAPMEQILRLRNRSSHDHGIVDKNNGVRHELAITKSIEKYGTLNEADILPDSYGGKLHPAAAKEAIASIPVVSKALRTGKVTPAKLLKHHKLQDQAQIKRIYKEVRGRETPLELNLYVTQPDEDPVATDAQASTGGQS